MKLTMLLIRCYDDLGSRDMECTELGERKIVLRVCNAKIVRPGRTRIVKSRREGETLKNLPLTFSVQNILAI